MQKKTFILAPLLLLLLVLGCDSPSTEEKSQDQSTVSETKALENTKKNAALPLLTEKNAAQILANYGKSIDQDTVVITTNMGNIAVRLYKGVPMHRANMLMLADRKYYDNTLFYRIIKDFMIQGGATDDFSIKGKQRKIGKYKIPAEMDTENFIHKRGAVSMAREYENNPEKQSVSYEFFIIQGSTFSALELDALEREEKTSFSPRQREIYTSIGGAPHLDGQHTVFGEVVDGMDVVNKIAAVKVGKKDWPMENVVIEKIRILGQE